MPQFGGNRGGGPMGGGMGPGRGGSGNGPMGGQMRQERGNAMGGGMRQERGNAMGGGMRHEGREPMGGGMRPNPMAPHMHEPYGRMEPAPRPRPHHAAPFGLILADIIWNQAHYRRLRRILERMCYNEPISESDERVLWESFGRRIEYFEAPDLLAWVDRELGYF